MKHDFSLEVVELTARVVPKFYPLERYCPPWFSTLPSIFAFPNPRCTPGHGRFPGHWALCLSDLKTSGRCEALFWVKVKDLQLIFGDFFVFFLIFDIFFWILFGRLKGIGCFFFRVLFGELEVFLVKSTGVLWVPSHSERFGLVFAVALFVPGVLKETCQDLVKVRC